MDLLQISPVSRNSFQYILVLIDDFLRFNRIYLLQKKNKSEVKIMLFLNKIKNHTDITPAILHTNQGGEFGSIVFKNFISQRGISLEQGPANSPQTNGLAERFNQTLFVKIRCMMAQCSVPLNYWDKAAKFASTLINMLALSALSWGSPSLVLVNSKATIENVRHIQTLLPFGLKTFVHTQSPASKNLPPLWCSKYVIFSFFSFCLSFLHFILISLILSLSLTSTHQKPQVSLQNQLLWPISLQWTTHGILRTPEDQELQ
jgi:hypothetical protein